ncbi:MAG: T9SS type A sorting domain-containing protein [Ignavibacteriales bacterium]|nr:MAG: T9SS type A sorting domain-containing protein [Ignavibacteriales bacterium]
MQRILIVFLFLIILTSQAVSQPDLKLYPDEIEFTNIFNRIKNVYFVNEGNQTLIIDSLSYNNNYYFTRFDGWGGEYPIYIAPGDSLLMDCILSGYYIVPSADTSDTMYVYSNGEDPVEDLEIDIKYFDDNYGDGIINGYVTDGTLPLQGVKVHFLYSGTYTVNSVETDQYGFYSVELPPGLFTVAAEKDSYYVAFHDDVFDPFNAQQVLVEDDSTISIDFTLEKMTETGYSVAGRISDSLTHYPLKKGIVVVRKGTHTPPKLLPGKMSSVVDEGIYTAFIKDDGTYNIRNIIQPDYYFVQSFSDYFIPTYYSLNNISPPFWQNADSILIDSHIGSRHIAMPRDSSYGGGTAIGAVTINQRFAGIPSDVVLFARNVNLDSMIFNYVFSNTDGTFKLPFLPYGTYKLVAQRIGYPDAYSNEFVIDSLNPEITGLNLNFNITEVKEDYTIPNSIELYQNYPNPFNPSTTIEFSLPEVQNVNLILTNILGEETSLIYSGNLPAGKHKFFLDGSKLSSGVYFVHLKAGMTRLTKKILLLK